MLCTMILSVSPLKPYLQKSIIHEEIIIMRNEEWSTVVMSDEWWVMSDEWWVMSDEWLMVRVVWWAVEKRANSISIISLDIFVFKQARSLSDFRVTLPVLANSLYCMAKYSHRPSLRTSLETACAVLNHTIGSVSAYLTPNELNSTGTNSLNLKSQHSAVSSSAHYTVIPYGIIHNTKHTHTHN